MITISRLGKLGRFGNQLYQYAGVRLYAESNGFSWALPPWDGVKLFRDIHSWRFAQRIKALSLPTIQLSDMASTSWSERLLMPFGLWKRDSLKNLYEHPHDNLSLYGYLQETPDIQRLRECRDTVRSWFQFKPEIESAFRRATEKYRPWLAVHLRFGDLVKRGIASNVDNTLAHVERLQRERTLFVATDSPEVKQRVSERCPIAPTNPLPELPPYAFDFWMLKEADVLIGSGSTFAWWAAFLSEKDGYWSPPLNRTWHGTVPPVDWQSL